MAIRLSTAIDRRKRIRRAVQYVEATLQVRPDARLSVGELAQVACMSPFHFIRVYANAVGASPDASVRSLRLQLARRMLATNARGSVTEVAIECGYENVAAFGRAYRRTFGVAPSLDARRELPRSDVVSSVVESPSIRLQALRVESGGGVWSTFDELVGHLDVGAVPRPAQDVYAVITPDGDFERAGVRENVPVRRALRLPGFDAGGGLHLRLTGQPQAVWGALRDDVRLRHARRYDEPLLLRYLNDPAYCPRQDQRVSLFVPLVRGTGLPSK